MRLPRFKPGGRGLGLTGICRLDSNRVVAVVAVAGGEAMDGNCKGTAPLGTAGSGVFSYSYKVLDIVDSQSGSPGLKSVNRFFM